MKFSLLSGEEVLLFRQRLAVIVAVVTVCFAVLGVRLWYLQVFEGTYYKEVAKGNRIRVVPQEAPRGIIYDREGQILAYNRPAFNVQLIPEDTPHLERSLRNLARVVEVPYERLVATARANRSPYGFKPIVLLADIGRKTADLIDTYQSDLPGISVTIESKRLYPTAYLTSHVVGYVGAINEKQLTELPLQKLRSGRIVGQSGIERVRNESLIGTDGGRQVEVDHVGRELRVLGDPVNPVPGEDIYLTVDLRLQRYVRSQMAGHDGVVVVMRPRTGEILSLNSFPDYDPNLFVGGIEDDVWTELTTGEEKPLVNKAIHGVYPPGSTFKMLMASAALSEGIIDPEQTLNCPGYYRMNRERWWCWKRSGHGDLNVVQAIEQSCNVFFYQLGVELGLDRINRYAGMFGLGQTTGVDLGSEKAGLVPTREWKQRNVGEPWYPGETVPIAIGQGYLGVTPLQLINYVNVVANRGVWVQPTVIRRVVSPSGVTVAAYGEEERETRLLPVPPEVFDVVRQGMVEAVNGKGTAVRARSNSFVVAGKTGTSQVVSRPVEITGDEDVPEALKPHALFVGFAPARDPQVTVLVLVEHGGSGGRTAAPIARRIMEFYFDNVEPLRQPFDTAEVNRGRAGSFRRSLQRAFGEPSGRLPAPGAGAASAAPATTPDSRG